MTSGFVAGTLVRNRRYRSDGFTLLELLISIFIFSIIITTIFASHGTVFSSMPAVADSIDLFQMAGVCLQRMTVDLASIRLTLPPAYNQPTFDSTPDPYRLVGDMSDSVEDRFHRLRFASLAHIPPKGSRQTGVAEIVYYVSRNKDGTYQLRRADDVYPYEPFEADPRDPILCDHVHAVTFTYQDQEGTSFDYWDSESEAFDFATPRLIGITLAIDQEGAVTEFQTTVRLPVVRDASEEDR